VTRSAAAVWAAALERMTRRLWEAVEEHARHEAAQRRHLGHQYRRRQLARRRRNRRRTR
jgi:hypothetical protein